MTDMKIRILRVLGRRSQQPTVIAIADGFTVRWTPRDDWSCTCDELEYQICPHIPAIEVLLDPRVTATDTRTR